MRTGSLCPPGWGEEMRLDSTAVQCRVSGRGRRQNRELRAARKEEGILSHEQALGCARGRQHPPVTSDLSWNVLE